MKLYEQIYNLAWMLLAIGICIGSIRLTVWDSDGPGSGFIPFIAGLVIGGAALVQFIREKSKKTSSERFWHSPLAARRTLYILIALTLMAYLMPILGFFLTSVLITTFMLRIIEPQRWAAVIATSLASCFLVYMLFYRLLQVSLPKGLFGI
jgi:putative tricarboxylic transport membrane protein